MRIKNIGWNIMGLSLPLVAAALSIPYLISLIGLERFGLLTVAWGLIGFAGVFDLGVGRAATQIIAQLLSEKKTVQIPLVIKTAGVLSVRMGACGALLLALLVFFGVHEYIKFDKTMSSEVSLAAYILAVTIPVQSLSAMYRGVNEAFEAFREINLIRVALGVANFIGPLLMALWTTNLGALVLTLLLSRGVALFFFSKYAFSKQLGADQKQISIADIKASPDIARQLFSFGGWVTVSNVIYPIMMQADRLLIGALISATAVATYVIPYEMVIQALIVCGAITTTIFPVLSGMVKANPEKVHQTFLKWLGIAVGAMVIVAGVFLGWAADILSLWLGNTLNEQSVSAVRILAIGLIPYAIGSMYLALIHAYARPDITAKAHLFEMPLFLCALYWAIAEYGIIGAAITWVGRTVMDALVLIFWFHQFGGPGFKKSAIDSKT